MAAGTDREAPASRFRIAGILSIGQVAARGVLALYFVLLIHRLSPREYGDFAYAVSWLAILIVLADGGVSRMLLRDIGRGGGDRGATAGALLGARGAWIAGTSLLVVVAALAGALRFEAAFTACLIAALVLEAASLGFEALGQATDRPWVVARAQIGGGVFLAGWAALLLAWHVTPLLGIIGIAAASGMRLAAQAAYWRRGSGTTVTWPGRAAASAILRKALPYLLLAGLAALYYRLDIVILHARRGAVETAPYAAAYRLVDAVIIAGGVLFTAVAPHMSRVIASDRGSVRREWGHYLRRVGAVAFVVSAAIALLAEPLARLVLGQRYAESAGADLRLLAPGIAFMLLQTVNASVVLMADNQRTVVQLTLAGVALNAALTWYLAGTHGDRGAAVATSIAEIVTFAGFAILVRANYRPGVMRERDAA